MDAPSGSFIAYATSPGKTLGPNISSGLYVSAIIENIDIASLPIEELFKKVRSRVRQTSGDTQIPWESTSLNGNFYFRP
jgi:uncharacterized caspase-like protein